MIDNVSAKRWGSQCALQACAMQPGFHSPLHSLLGNRLGTRALPRRRGLDSPITTFVQPETLKMSLSACIHHPVNRFAMLAGAIAFLTPALAAAEFTLAPLPYASSALEPHIDARTMEIHHGRHHNAYVTNLNAQIKTFPDLEKMSLEQMQGQISKFNTAVRNNGGGHYNHDLFWKLMAPEGQRGKPGDALLGEITKTFGSLEEMKKRFDQAALGRFGSGWAWLIVTPEKKLLITSTPNQDNPLMDLPGIDRGTPILGLDVWEHAYYLKYQNKRGEYATNWWNVVNWDEVTRRYDAAMK
jgi:superoxide dismutase, Fe-Mn family